MAYELVTFDAYMGLLDIQGSLVPVVAGALSLDEAEARGFVRIWRTQQMARAAASNSLGLGRTSFRDCTRMGLDFALVKNDIDLDEKQRSALVAAWDYLKPWPEAVQVIDGLKAQGLSVAILSNGDQDQLEAIDRNAFDSAFDHVLSTETCGFYKPHPSVYALPQQALGVPMARVLHVAGGGGDVLGAVAAGMACYWSNRTGDPAPDPAYPATHEGRELGGLSALL